MVVASFNIRKSLKAPGFGARWAENGGPSSWATYALTNPWSSMKEMPGAQDTVLGW